jgi:hypothetical protein
MRTRIFLFAIVFISPFLLASTLAGDQLVLIQKGQATDFMPLTEIQMRPHFSGSGYILASVSRKAADLIRQKGFHVEVIDDNPWSEPYFFARPPKKGQSFRIPPSFNVIARVPDGIILKGSSEDINELFNAGLQVVPIEDKILPIIEREAPQFRGLSPDLYNAGRSTADQVSDSTLTEYLNRLVDFQTRYSCTDSIEAAGQWIHDLFTDLGFTEVYFDSFPFHASGYTCDVQRSVVAVKAGSLNPEKVVICGGHYDSWVLDYEPCDPETLCPGADDNASGTVVALEAARIFVEQDMDVTMMFIAFGAEEQGLWGSSHFAEEAYNQGMDIKVMVNMDMVAYLGDDIWDIKVRSPEASRPFAAVMEEFGRSSTDLLPYYSEGTGPDDLPFARRGYNTVFTEEGDWPSPNWHRCTDTIENLSIPYLTDVAEMVVSSLYYYSNIPMVPIGFRAVNVGNGTSIYLSWDPNDELDLAGYNLYWGTQSGVYDSVRTVTETSDTLLDLVEGEIYYIAVSAFDTDANESFLTAEVELAATSIPLQPAGIRSISLEHAIFVEWDPSESELDLSGHNLYRWIPGDSPDTALYAFIAEPESSFSDDNAEAHVLYGYYLTAVDMEIPPNESRSSDRVFGRLATHDMGILVVDNTLNGSGGPFSPTDEDVDAFYSNIFGDYNAQAAWDTEDSIEVNRYLMDYDLGVYSVVLWHTDVRGGEFTEADTTAMRKYLDGGGNLWLSGWQVLGSLQGDSRPYLVFEDSSFISQYAGIDSALTTSTGDQDFIGALGLMGSFPDVYFDSTKVFPLGALYNTEILLPPFNVTGPLYSYISSDSANSEYHGQVVAVGRSKDDYGFGLTDFPLYFLGEEGAKPLVDAVMELFGEPVTVGDGREQFPLLRAFALSQNYPNPFNPSTTISFDIPGEARETQTVCLTIYDIRGRRVKELVNSELTPGTHTIHWNGRNDRGEPVSSGIYLYTLKVGKVAFTRKMVIMK